MIWGDIEVCVGGNDGLSEFYIFDVVKLERFGSGKNRPGCVEPTFWQ